MKSLNIWQHVVLSYHHLAFRQFLGRYVFFRPETYKEKPPFKSFWEKPPVLKVFEFHNFQADIHKSAINFTYRGIIYQNTSSKYN